MTADTLTFLIIVSLGLFCGTAIGLGIGYCAKKQKTGWDAMTWQEKKTNILLCLACSAILIITMAWYVLP